MRQGEPALTQTTSDPPLGPVFRRITIRIVPLLILLYVIAFLDRVNVGFAALTMNRDLGISESAYGLAAGIFFAGYLMFSVPSNLMLARLGAGRWIGIIMVTWGVFSSSQAFVHSAASYTVARFFIGAAEAGFFPGIILYLSLWLPRSRRAGVMGLFTLSIPISAVLGAPISARLMELTGKGGLQGWQWLFLLEGLPAIVLGLAVPWLMAPGPENVLWLAPREKIQLLSSIDREEQTLDVLPGPRSTASRIVGLTAEPATVYFLLMVGLYTLSFWIPRILQSLGLPLRRLGWETALVFAAGGVALVLWSRAADRSNNPRRHLFAAFLLAGVGFCLTAVTKPAVVEAGLAMAAAGVLSAMPIFWGSLRAKSGTERATVVAATNAIGNIGGLVGPYAIGRVLASTHRFGPGLLVTAACMLTGSLLCLPAMYKGGAA